MATSIFGKDTWCLDALQPGRMVSGVALVAQNQYHRLITPRGMLRGGPEEENYGLDLAALVGQADTPALRNSMPGQIRAELLKDERVSDVRVGMTSTQEGGLTTYTFTVVGQTAEGPFELVLKASNVTVELLGLKA